MKLLWRTHIMMIGDFSIPSGYRVVNTLLNGVMVPLLVQNTLPVGDGSGSGVLTAADLRAIPSDRLKSGDIRVVVALGTVFVFDPTSTTADDGATVLKPSDGLAAGRWVGLTTVANAAALTAATNANSAAASANTAAGNATTAANNAVAAASRTGNATLVAGTKAVADASVTANTIVLLSRKTAGGTLGNLTYTVSAGVGFTINSTSGTDTSIVSYHLLG
jgi:hypothetical protein